MATKREIQKARQKARERFLKARKAESAFKRQLLSVSRQIGSIVKAFTDKDGVKDVSSLIEQLNRYADILKPWATAVSERMLAEVSRKDAKAWIEHGRAMGVVLRNEVRNAPTGEAMRLELAECVDLITSLPRKAAERVHHLTVEGMIEGGRRASEIAQDILATGHVTASRARLIARTEVARTASTLTESRAKFVGSEGYIWRTAGDTDVRTRHKKLEGKFIRWDDPPVAGEQGEHAHAGQIYNCRCWPEPVLPDQL